MLAINKNQFARLGERCFEDYINRLAKLLGSEAFAKDLARHVADPGSEQLVRSLARNLVAKATSLGIDREGDVTAFCLLAVSIDPEFRQSGLYGWISAIIQASHHASEERMDAIYCLLPDSLRTKVFCGQGER